MKKLIRVVRNAWTPEINLVHENPNIRLRRGPQAIMTRETNVERTNFTTEGEFFLVDEADVNGIMTVLAETNPGREIQVYNLEQSAQCPAAAMVTKKVTKDGILPV